MSTLAWVLILAALIIARSVGKGRALNIPEDLSDAFKALVTGRTDDFAEVLGRKGDAYTAAGNAVAQAAGSATGAIIVEGVEAGTINGQIVYWAKKLGSQAKGYRWGRSGPDYYDCSGLMYAAIKQIGYKGFRFYTATMMMAPGMVKVSGSPQVGDFALWPGHHVGVVIGPNRMYAARSVKRGIGESNIDATSKDFGSNPIYVRWNPHA